MSDDAVRTKDSSLHLLRVGALVGDNDGIL